MTRIFGGLFHFMARHYSKTFRSHAEQISLLSERGLAVRDSDAALHVLASMNYYRFTGYAIPFMSDREHFRPGIAFDDVLSVCRFDSDLRDLFFEAIEAVELDFRARFAYRFSEMRGALGYRDSQNFTDASAHAKTLHRIEEEISRSKEICILHFKSEYCEGEIPIWAVVEVASFGTLAAFYNNLQTDVQNAISSDYGIRGDVFGSYIKHLSILRNICAHHARLYDRRFYGFRPLNEWRVQKLKYAQENRLFFPQCLLVYRLLKNVNTFDRENWRGRLLHRLEATPRFAVVDLPRIMGIPNDAATSDLWI